MLKFCLPRSGSPVPPPVIVTTLPLTNLTMHVDASNIDDVWAFYQGAAPYHNTPPADGQLVEMLDDTEGGPLAYHAAAFPAIYRISGSLMRLPCLDFDGTKFYKFTDNAANLIGSSSMITASGKTFVFAIYVRSVDTNFAGASIYLNRTFFGDGGYFGMSLRDNGAASLDANGVSSRYKVIAWNYDGATGPGGYAAVELSFSLNSIIVPAMRHDGTNIYLSIGGGPEVSTQSGPTTSVIQGVFLGKGATTTNNADFLFGEHAIYNAALSLPTLAQATDFVNGKWN